MNNFNIVNSNEKDSQLIIDNLVKYNLSKVPLMQDEAFIEINKVIKDKDEVIIAGINSRMYCWNCLYIDSLWVDENYRHKGLGSQLLKAVESEAKEKKCLLIHLDTFDFQAKDFYLKHGYEIFGVLDGFPQNHQRYYLKKILS